MKRTARRQSIELSATQQARLHKLQETICVKEKADLSRKARVFQSQQQAAEVELARAAELLRAEQQER